MSSSKSWSGPETTAKWIKSNTRRETTINYREKNHQQHILIRPSASITGRTIEINHEENNQEDDEGEPARRTSKKNLMMLVMMLLKNLLKNLLNNPLIKPSIQTFEDTLIDHF